MDRYCAKRGVVSRLKLREETQTTPQEYCDTKCESGTHMLARTSPSTRSTNAITVSVEFVRLLSIAKTQVSTTLFPYRGEESIREETYNWPIERVIRERERTLTQQLNTSVYSIRVFNRVFEHPF